MCLVVSQREKYRRVQVTVRAVYSWKSQFSGGNFGRAGVPFFPKLPNSDTLEILSLEVLFKCQVRDEDRFLIYKPQARRRYISRQRGNGCLLQAFQGEIYFVNGHKEVTEDRLRVVWGVWRKVLLCCPPFLKFLFIYLSVLVLVAACGI